MLAEIQPTLTVAMDDQQQLGPRLWILAIRKYACLEPPTGTYNTRPRHRSLGKAVTT
jgi:hypothetical protein